MNMSSRELESAKVARTAAEAGMVLLENNGALPLKKSGKIALYGVGAVRTVRGGTGSGDPFNGGLSSKRSFSGDAVSIDLSPRYHIQIRGGFEKAGYTIVNSSDLDAVGKAYDSVKSQMKDVVMSTFAFPEPFLREEKLLIDAEQTDTAVLVISRNSGEGHDRSLMTPTADGEMEIGDYLPSLQEKENIRLLRKHFQKLIVVLNVGGIIDTKSIRASKPDAILLMGLAGQEGGPALVNILNGTATPSGKLTDTWAEDYSDYPASATFGDHDGNIDAENYREGIFVGYRYFESFGKKPVWPFGYGLSYTAFRVGTPDIVLQEGAIHFSLSITNTGKMQGAEVIQLYSCACTGLDAPAAELVAFGKTGILQPQETERVQLMFSLRDLAVYEEEREALVIKAGRYILSYGTSLADRKETALLQVTRDDVIALYPPVLPLARKLTELHHVNENPENRTIPVLTYEPQDGRPKTLDESFLQEKVSTWTTDPSYTPVRDYETVHRVDRRQLTVRDVMEERASFEEFCAQLTDRELAMLNCGTGWGVADAEHPIVGENSESVPGAAGETTRDLAFMGIPSMIMVDGPGGIRVRQEFEADNLITGKKETVTHYCTAWPSGTLLAQSFDTQMLFAMGEQEAVEIREIGVQMLLAPGMNIHRDPMCGRNFEYYSEDPLVSGRMAAAFVRGLQNGPGTGACIKHFAANNQETNRHAVDERIGQRALREIYLKGFEIAVRESAPLAIMTSYNKINGVPTADSYDLCTRLTRGEWKFEGMIMTDWNGGSSSPDLSMHAGNDLIMPGGPTRIRQILMGIDHLRPEFDGRGQIKFTRFLDFLPFYEDQWNSFTPSADGKVTISAPVDPKFSLKVEDGKILCDGKPIYTKAAALDRSVRFTADDFQPFTVPLTTEIASIDEEQHAIVYRGEYTVPQRICRGDLQACAVRNLKVLVRLCCLSAKN